MKNLGKVIISKTISIVGLKLDTSVIPKGEFCYEYNKQATDALIDEWNTGFYIRICPYHLTLNEKYCYCMYTGKFVKDKGIKDKTKNCNINKHT